MDALIAKADAIQPLQKKRKTYHTSAPSSSKTKSPSKNADPTLSTIAKRTSIPKSLQDSRPLPEDVPTYKHIANKKLRTHLSRQSEQGARAKALVEDAEMLLMDEAGGLEVEDEMDRTWRVGQTDVVQNSGQEAGKGRREFKLDGGPYRSRYTRNGRHLAIVGRMGHVSTFDWQSGTVHAELQLEETCRDITFLQDHSFFAATRLEFLPYHWLLASVGNPGYLKYQDTSTGQLIAEHRTKLGACNAMTQNLHNAVIHLGHQNGCITLWTPNLPHPAVQLLAHMGPVVSLSVDPSEGGRYMASAGRDGTVKVWDCRNWKGAVREWTVRGGGDPEVEWSQRGYLAVASSGNVNIYHPPSIHTPFHIRTPPPLYMTHPIPHRPLTSVRFAPFQDVLTVGHAAGLSSILVPGSGEPNFDSREADPYENKKARSEREVKALLDKIQPDLITLDPELIGTLAPVSKLTTEVTPVIDAKGKTTPRTEVPYARLPRIDRLREREKRRMRGKGKSMKRYLRKQRKNVIDPAAVNRRSEKAGKTREEKKRAAAIAAAGGQEEKKKPSALDRFKRSK
ncbi:BING4CT-domain-containing protein [Gymnopilus junonius]|uniref:BING4CT-domain-containing protein n=1 Tax=Gymnopilus junonius TaxID=109634 RepID=A0A9P5NJA3_GYMJU|nr:BING4CT-domain-containing protein [Gymnopilus junonius]